MTFKAAQALVQSVGCKKHYKRGEGTSKKKKSYCSICFNYHTCNPFTLASQHIAIPQFSTRKWIISLGSLDYSPMHRAEGSKGLVTYLATVYQRL